jgi:hypothetical protein
MSDVKMVDHGAGLSCKCQGTFETSTLRFMRVWQQKNERSAFDE